MHSSRHASALPSPDIGHGSSVVTGGASVSISSSVVAEAEAVVGRVVVSVVAVSTDVECVVDRVVGSVRRAVVVMVVVDSDVVGVVEVQGST